jgi:hypothetical protein
MQKALELVQSVPKRAQEMEFTKNILNYPGDTRRLGRIYRHVKGDWNWSGIGEILTGNIPSPRRRRRRAHGEVHFPVQEQNDAHGAGQPPGPAPLQALLHHPGWSTPIPFRLNPFPGRQVHGAAAHGRGGHHRVQAK